MTGAERRARDPVLLAEVRARWAQMRAARASRETAELRKRWPPTPNAVEALLLRRRLAAAREGHDGER